jgi:hypothetical protein
MTTPALSQQMRLALRLAQEGGGVLYRFPYGRWGSLDGGEHVDTMVLVNLTKRGLMWKSQTTKYGRATQYELTEAGRAEVIP